ncbi:MAG: lysophospholipid acyltransferase family protein [Candidatus Promineifilaceae bacterium]
MLAVWLQRAIVRIVLALVGSLKVSGREHVPAAGPYIVVVNHMSKADPPLLYLGLPPTRMRFFAAEKWRRHPLFGPLMGWAGAVFVNREEVDRPALRQALKALDAGEVFGLAPEGTRSNVGALIPAREGAAYLASRAGVPILPAALANTDRFGHNLKRLRRTRFELRFGPPFRLPEPNSRVRAAELEAHTHLVMAHIAALLPAHHRGYYADSPALAALLQGEDPWPVLATQTLTRME